MKKFIKRIRTSIYTLIAKLQVKSIGNKCNVNALCKFTNMTVLGENCHFNGMRIYGKGNVIIGDNFHSGAECMIITSFHNYDKGCKIPYDETIIDKDVVIENNVWIGHRVVILGGVTLGEGCIIQAGSVVVKNIPAYAIAGGSPAVTFKYRDIEHYTKLKEQRAFF